MFFAKMAGQDRQSIGARSGMAGRALPYQSPILMGGAIPIMSKKKLKSFGHLASDQRPVYQIWIFKQMSAGRWLLR
jgi:hypothetical protein